MKIIETVLIDDVLTPAEPLPTDAIKIVFGGERYVIYELGDEIPAELPVIE